MAGYVAKIARDSLFRPHIYQTLFSHFTYVKLNNPAGIVNHPHEWKQAMNTLVFDESPHPGTIGNIRGNWVPSLGIGGFCGVGYLFDSSAGSASLCIYCFSGPDPSILREQERFMKSLSDQKKTMGEAFTALQPYRELAIENNRRLLYLLHTFLLDLESSRVTITHGEEGEKASGAKLKPMDFLINQDKLPSYLFPYLSTDEDEEGEGGEPIPKSIIPDLTVFVDDIVPYDVDYFLVYSHCAPTLEEEFVVKIQDPTQTISIFKLNPDTDTSIWLHGYPAINTRNASRMFQWDGVKVFAQNEEGEHTMVGKMDGHYPVSVTRPPPKSHIDSCLDFTTGSTQTIIPQSVRISRLNYFY